MMSVLPHTLLLATRNRNKVVEISDLLKYQKISVKSLRDYPDVPSVEEKGATLEENAVLKAKAGFEASGLPTLGDDTGLEVVALGGAPGVQSARYSGPGATYESNVQKLLKDMRHLKEYQRNACFRCVMALVWKDGTKVVEGRVDGTILGEPRGTGGFGYDPVFFHPPTGFTFAEMPMSLKNQFSHRSIALRQIVQFIVSQNSSPVL
jgi:XTP/dITP diphosphohydrolase